MNISDIIALADAVINGYELTLDDARLLADEKSVDVWDVMYGAQHIRKIFFGNRIKFCSIINARSGACNENCAFCAQSLHHSASPPIYPLLKKETMIEAGKTAKKAGAQGFSIVTSGRSITQKQEFEMIGDTISELQSNGLYICASLGELKADEAHMLKRKGLKRFHHNLETAEKYFNKICTTHSYQDKIQTIKSAQEAGLEICSGGIFGMGETWDHRIEMAFALRALKADSIPINFLNPIPGTPLETMPLLKPLEALRIISIYRFIFPQKDIIICGGRERVLRDLQVYVFYAGANGTMLGNYLTTQGRPAEDDIQLVKDLELSWQ